MDGRRRCDEAEMPVTSRRNNWRYVLQPSYSRSGRVGLNAARGGVSSSLRTTKRDFGNGAPQ